MAPGDQVTAGEQATADHDAAATPAQSDATVAQHTGESHDGVKAAETVPSATSDGGAASAETEAATTHEAAQQRTDREQAEAEQGILGAAPVRHAPAPASAPGTSAAPAPAALIESTQIRRAITQAEKRTDLNWSVFIGTLGENPRAQAEARHAELGPAAAKSVLIAVDPTAHRLEIVTGTHARAQLDDRSCALAAASMTSTFAVRDLDGGIAYGILAMVEHVRRMR